MVNFITSKFKAFIAYISVNRLDIAIMCIGVGIIIILFMLSLAANQAVRRTSDTQELIVCVMKYFDLPSSERVGAVDFLEDCRED